IAFCRYCFVYSISMNSFTGLPAPRSCRVGSGLLPLPSGLPSGGLRSTACGETGCKSTTFFLSTKISDDFFSKNSKNSLSSTPVAHPLPSFFLNSG
ncbi:MAG: hypothetical protein K2I87_04205, partial [Bacteroidales bacterium]|nr:hypothetical protein [Bacteroidales bacterium]